MSDAVTNTEVSSFWSVLSRLYKNRDSIVQSSNKIIEYTDQIDAIDNFETFKQVC